MAPSQHIRSTLVLALLGATLALSACGAQQPGAAAVIDGTTISDKDVQTVALQLNALAPGQAKLTPSIILLNLILAPYVIAEADHTGKGVPDAEARKVLAKVPNPSRPSVDFVRMQLEIQSLDQADKMSILTKLGKSKITVNPRYGTFDAKQVSLLPTAPNWIKPSAASGAK